MLNNKKIDIKIRGLKFNLDQINTFYEETLRDVVSDSGMEYGKKYPLNSQTIELFNYQDKLQKSREEKLFFSIFNFTQIYYSIKDYLKKEFPERKDKIEGFYSTKLLGLKARKDISNDLKHNPENDLKYDFRFVDRQHYIEGRTKHIKLNLKNSWFYHDIDSVEYCNKLYKELLDFLTTEFTSGQNL
jgi:hypothetical protein